MIDELDLFLRLMFAFIFISTALSKYINFDKHIGIVSDYKIFSPKYSKVISKIDILLEVIVGILLLLDFIRIIAVSIALLLLLSYTLAIIVNLTRGRNKISCGCGGVIGTHQLSWNLVFRNIVFIITVYLISLSDSTALFSVDTFILTHNFNEAFGYDSWIIFLLFNSFLLLFLLFREGLSIHSQFTKILHTLK